MQYRITKNYKIGLVYNKSTRIGTYDNTPAKLKIGFAYNNDKFNYGLDYERQSIDLGRIMTGLEYNKEIYSIPMSFRFGGRGNLIDDPSGWDIKNSIYVTAGIGLELKLTNIRKLNINVALNQSAYPNLLTPIFRMMYISLNIK